MRFSLSALIIFILILIFALGLIIFAFWRFGIFKREVELPSIVLDIKAKIDFVNNYPFQDLNNYFQTLPAIKIEIPEIQPEEIGRSSLF